jgi:hypothetical protein
LLSCLSVLSCLFDALVVPTPGNEEPSLDELLAEPIVRLMTGPDRVKKADVRRLARVAARERLVWQSD